MAIFKTTQQEGQQTRIPYLQISSVEDDAAHPFFGIETVCQGIKSRQFLTQFPGSGELKTPFAFEMIDIDSGFLRLRIHRVDC